MSMADYYQDQEMEAQAARDNEEDRLEKIAQAKILEDKTKKLIQQQSKIIIDTAIAAHDKEWMDWIEKTFYPSANWSDFDNEVWKARKKEIGI